MINKKQVVFGLLIIAGLLMFPTISSYFTNKDKAGGTSGIPTDTPPACTPIVGSYEVTTKGLLVYDQWKLQATGASIAPSTLSNSVSKVNLLTFLNQLSFLSPDFDIFLTVKKASITYFDQKVTSGKTNVLGPILGQGVSEYPFKWQANLRDSNCDGNLDSTTVDMTITLKTKDGTQIDSKDFFGVKVI